MRAINAPVYAATFITFIILCLVSIDDSHLLAMRSRQSLQLSRLGTSSIAPDNLPRAADLLRTSLPVQDQAFPTDSLTRLPAWATLQNTLSAYTERLKLLDAQGRELDHHLQTRAVWTSVAMTALIIINLALLAFNKRGSMGGPA